MCGPVPIDSFLWAELSLRRPPPLKHSLRVSELPVVVGLSPTESYVFKSFSLCKLDFVDE